MDSRIGRRRVVRLGGTALGTGLAGCPSALPAGRDGTGGSGRTSVSLLLDWKANATQAGHFVAREKGFYEDEGLAVEITGGNGGQSTAKQVALGKYDLGLTSAAAALQTRAEDLSLRAYAAAQQGPNSTVYTTRQVFGARLRRPEQLAGKTVAIPSAASNLALLKTVLDERDVLDTVRFLNVGWGELTASVPKGEADAALGAFPDGIALRREGHDASQLWLSDYVDTVGRSVVAAPSFAADNPAALRSFLRADARGWARAVSDPEEAMELMIDAVPRLSKSRQLGVRKIERTAEKLVVTETVREHGWGYQPEGVYRSVNEALAAADMLPTDMAVSEAYTNEYLDEDYRYVGDFAGQVSTEG